MTRKNLQKINFTSEESHKSKSAARKKSMSTIRCVCGFEILVVPDLKAMDLAIKNHVAEHKLAGYDSEELLGIDSLAEFLTEQVLIVASKMNLSTTN